MPQYAKQTVTNREVIAIDQDPLGLQGDVAKTYNDGQLQIWAKKLKNGSIAVALLNRDATAHRITVNWSDIGISGEWQVRDLWKHSDNGKFNRQYTAEVPAHAAAMLRISRIARN